MLRHRRRRLILRIVLFLGVLALVFAAPQIWITLRFSPQVYGRVADVPPHEYGVVFGAAVEPGGVLTDVARERIDAAVLLYKAGGVRKLFVSGTNRHNSEADAIARYAQDRGVPAGDLLVDGLGIDTHDTCRHLARIAAEAVLITQEYHLPRAMYYCANDGVQPVGLAANRLGLLPVRGVSAIDIYATRAGRAVREAGLTWLFALGLADRWSHEAEDIEASGGGPR